jgi:hypothetical protein
MATRVILLGPQRREPNLARAVADVDDHTGGGKIAVVTAGWEEREGEIRELDEHVGGRAVNLEVWHRVEDVFRRDGELFAALRERHDTLRKLHEIYKLRLHYALEAARDLLQREGDARLLERERESAIAAVRQLDAEHLRAVRELHAEFAARWNPAERDAVVRHRHDLARRLESTPLLCIAGGHVGSLLHRLELFDVVGLHRSRPIIAWSAGAMAICERVVLFHDSPPQGQGDAEVFGAGLGVCGGVIPLPHASKRLRVHDGRRVELFARRFAEDKCFALDQGARLDWDGSAWRAYPPACLLAVDGRLQPCTGAEGAA